MGDRHRTQIQVEGVASPRVDDPDQQRGQEAQAERPVHHRVEEGEHQQIKGDVLTEHSLGDASGLRVLEQRQALPLGPGPTRENQRDEGGRTEGGASAGAAKAGPCDPDRAEAWARTHPQGDDDVGDQVDKSEQEAADEQRGLHEDPGREDVLEAQRVVPLDLGEEPDDGTREEKDEHRQPE